MYEVVVLIWRVIGVKDELVVESGNFIKYFFLGGCVVILCTFCVFREKYCFW